MNLAVSGIAQTSDDYKKQGPFELSQHQPTDRHPLQTSANLTMATADVISPLCEFVVMRYGTFIPDFLSAADFAALNFQSYDVHADQLERES